MNAINDLSDDELRIVQEYVMEHFSDLTSGEIDEDNGFDIPLLGDEIIKRAELIIVAIYDDERDKIGEIRDALELMDKTVKDAAEKHGMKFKFGYEGENFMAPILRGVNSFVDSVFDFIIHLPGISSIAGKRYTFPLRQSRDTQMAISDMIGFVSAFIEDESFWIIRDGLLLLNMLDYYPTIDVFNSCLRYAKKCDGWGMAHKLGEISIDEIFTMMRDAKERAEDRLMKEIQSAKTVASK